MTIDERLNPNNGIYQVQEVQALSNTSTQLTLAVPGIPSPDQPPASFLFAREVTIRHDLGNDRISYHLNSIEQKNSIKVQDEINDLNHLTLKPALPLRGNIQIIIISTQKPLAL